MNRNPKKIKKQLCNAMVFAAALMTIVGLGSWYLLFVQAEEQRRVDQIVQENAIQSVALIQERLENDRLRIEEVGQYLGEEACAINSRETLRIIQNFQGRRQFFKELTIATADGTLYGADGTIQGNIATHSHFCTAMRGETGISGVEQALDDHRDIVCITAPIEREGSIIGTVNGSFLMSELGEFLSAESFGGRGYSYMANAQGHIFARPKHPDADHNFTNIYESFQANSSVSDEKLDEMRRNMQAGRAGRIFYQWRGDKRTMHYMPTGINDWYLLSVLPNEIVASRAIEMTQQVFALTGALLLVLLLLVFYIDRARSRGKKQLAEVYEELLTIYNTISGGIFKCRIDEGFTLVGANDGFYRFIGYSREELEAQYANELVRLMQPEDVERVRSSLARQLQGKGTTSDELRLVSSDGSVKWLLISGDIVRDSDEEALVYCCFTDISELKRTQEELRAEKQRYDLIVEETQEIIFEWNPIEHSIRHSKIFEKKFGYPGTLEDFPESILEKQLVPKEDEEACMGLYRRIEAGAHFASSEFRIKKADGSFLWCRVSITSLCDSENQIYRAVGVISDIDRAKRELQAATERAQRDAMTGLYNKTAVEQLIALRMQKSAEPAALLMMDIDNFKNVNDSLGHAAGDSVLMEVSRRLKSRVRGGDLIGRIGGDEFVVFLEKMEPDCDLREKLAEIVQCLKQPICGKDLECAITCSIGIALFPQDAKSYDELIEKADTALYFAKQHGKSQFVFYHRELRMDEAGRCAQRTEICEKERSGA